MYKARNGFTLLNDETPDGWRILCAEDILTALLAFPYFQTAADCFIWEAIDQATTERKVYADITEFAGYIAENYL